MLRTRRCEWPLAELWLIWETHVALRNWGVRSEVNKANSYVHDWRKIWGY